MPINRKPKQRLCRLCKLTFVDSSAIRNHVLSSRRHLETFGCGLCKRPFLDQNDLQLHTKGFHPDHGSASTGAPAPVVEDPKNTIYESDPPAMSGTKPIGCKHCVSTFRTVEEARNNHLLFQTHIFEQENTVSPVPKKDIHTPPATASDWWAELNLAPAERSAAKFCFACNRRVPSSILQQHAAQRTHIQNCMDKGFYYSPFFSATEKYDHRSICDGEPTEPELPLLRNLGPGGRNTHKAVSTGILVGLPIDCEACGVTVFPSLQDTHRDSPGHIQKCKEAGGYCEWCHQTFFRIVELRSHLDSCASGRQRREPEWTFCETWADDLDIEKVSEHRRHDIHLEAGHGEGLFCSTCFVAFFSKEQMGLHAECDKKRPMFTASRTTDSSHTASFNDLDKGAVKLSATEKSAAMLAPSSAPPKPCFACNIEVPAVTIEKHAAQITHIQNCKAKGFYCRLCDSAFFSATENHDHRRNCNEEAGTADSRSKTPLVRSLGPAWGRTQEVFCGQSELSSGLPIHCEACGFTVFPSLRASHVNSSEHIRNCKTSGRHCKGCRQTFFNIAERRAHADSCVFTRRQPERKYIYCEACDDMIGDEEVSQHRHDMNHIEACHGEGLFCTTCLVPFFSEKEMAFHAERNETHSFPARPIPTASRRSRASSERTPFNDPVEENVVTLSAREDSPGKLDPPMVPPKPCFACCIEIPPSMIDQHAAEPTHDKKRKAKGLYCTYCFTSFFSRPEREQHGHECKRPLREPKVNHQALQEFRCCDCDTSFANRKRLDKHLKICNSVPRGIFNCEPCEVKCSTRKDLILHLIGSNHKPVKCHGSTLCARRFRRFADMIQHLESGACVSHLNKQTIDRLVRAQDVSRSITIKDAALPMHSLAGIDEKKFLTPPAATIVGEIDGDSKYDWDTDIYTSAETSASTPTLTMPTAAGIGGREGLWRQGGIMTPSSTTGTPSGILTPATIASEPGTWTPVDGPSSITDLVFQLANPRTCATCLKTFSSTTSLAQHVASPVHAEPMYHCPREIFLEMGIKLDGKKPAHKEREFKALSALVQHIEAGACQGGIEGREKAVRFLEGTLARLGFGGGRFLDT